MHIQTRQDQSEEDDHQEGWEAALGKYVALLNSSIEEFGDEDIFDDLDQNEWNEPPSVRAEVESLSNSDDDDQTQKWPQFYDQTDMANPQLQKGMEFKNAASFRTALREYCIREGIEYKWVKNEGHKMSAHCKNKCGWKIYASVNKESNSIQIKSLMPNCTCGRTMDNSHVISTYLAQKFREDFTDNPEWKVENVQKTVRKKIGVEITPSQAYRAKRKAKEALEGKDAEQYSKLRDYAKMIMTMNPGSTVKIMCQTPIEGGQPKFLRMYVRFHAQKIGFLAGCRPIVGLDACHLKGQFGGQLMAAIGRDGNDNQFPIALAMVEQGNKYSWEWSLDIFSDDIGHPEELGLVFMSDRQKGLVDVIQQNYPNIEHRYCMKHLYANFKLRHKGNELRDAMWACAFATTPKQFEDRMEDVKKLSTDAYDELKNVQAQWSISHFSPRAKCDMLTNNITESFNAYVKPARDKPIISLFEWIRLKLTKRFHIKLTSMKKYGGSFCPNVLDKLEKIKVDSRMCFPLPCGRQMYQIQAFDGDHVVDLNVKECSCRLWNVTGIPSKHAVAAIQANKEKPESYLHECYSKETYNRIYNEIIRPIPGEALWERTGLPYILPPDILRPPGRPKKLRKKAADEPKNAYTVSRKNKPIHCGKCHQPGHNAKSCKSSMTGLTPWQRRMLKQQETQSANRDKGKEVMQEKDQPSSKSAITTPAFK